VTPVADDQVGPAAPTFAAAATQLSAGAAAYVLTVWECLAVGLIGPDAGFLPHERSLIQPCVERIIKRLSPDLAGKAAAWGDYLLLAVGLSMYAQRLLSARRREAAPTEAPDPMAQPTLRREAGLAPAAPSPDGPSTYIGADWRDTFAAAAADAGEL
jgi:hypothetical protein